MGKTYKHQKKYDLRKKADNDFSKLTEVEWQELSGIDAIPSHYKRDRRRRRRSQENQALKQRKPLPNFKKTDEYDWY